MCEKSEMKCAMSVEPSGEVTVTRDNAVVYKGTNMNHATEVYKSIKQDNTEV